MHVKIVDGVPVQYSIGQLRRDNPQVSFPEAPPPEMLAAYGVYVARFDDAPPTRFHTAGAQVAQAVGFEARISREWIAPDLDSVKVRAASELSHRRDSKIEAGFDFNGVLVPCDDKSIGRYTAAYVLARDNPDMTRQWKMPHGFVTLNASELIALAAGAAAFVQACFDEQAEKISAIEGASSVEAVEAILLDAAV